MNITLMAHDKKKELMVQFCTAYKSREIFLRPIMLIFMVITSRP